MEANCLMINAGPTGSETLKNLVLPGIGKFTVLDGQTLQTSDLGNNFFAVKSALGQPRAKVSIHFTLLSTRMDALSYLPSMVSFTA